MKAIKRMLATILCWIMLLNIVTICSAAAEDEFSFYGDMNFDVIFVTDASGTMVHADAEGFAPEFMKLFLDLCDTNTCRAGYSVYSQFIVDECELMELKKPDNYKKIIEGIEAINYDINADTDIALGLTNAMSKLKKVKDDPNRSPIIILLSDGITDLPHGPRTVEESKAEEENTLNELSKMSVPVFAVGLNYDGTVDKDEMKHIGEVTGGKDYIITSSNQLNNTIIDIFSRFTRITPMSIDPKDENGICKAEVPIDNSSIYCANIVIQGENLTNEPNIFSPNGYNVKIDNNHVKLKKSKSYMLVKLVFPEVGVWRLEIPNVSKDDVHISLLKSYTFIVDQQFSSTNLNTGEKIEITASLSNDEGILTDNDLIGTLSGETIIKNRANNQEEVIQLTSNKDGTFTGDYSLLNPGEYEFTTTIRANNGSFEKTSRTETIYVQDLMNASQIRVEQALSSKSIHSGDEIEAIAKIFSESTSSYINDTEFLVGFKAELCVKNENDEIIKTPMDLQDDGTFKVVTTVDKVGTYKLYTVITKKGEDNEKCSSSATLNVLSAIPKLVNDTISITVRSKPMATTKDIDLKEYVIWDKEESVTVSLTPEDLEIISYDYSENNTVLSISGLKKGNASAVLRVTDSSGQFCDVKLEVTVENGWTGIFRIIIVILLFVILITIIYLMLRPKFRSSVNLTINVPSDLMSLQPADQDIVLPKRKHSITLKAALSQNINSHAASSLEEVVDKMNLNAFLKNIHFVAKDRKHIVLIAKVGNSPWFIDAIEVKETKKIQMSSGKIVRIKCGEDGEMVLKYE